MTSLASQTAAEPAAMAPDFSQALVDDNWMNPAERRLFDAALALVPTLQAREQKCLLERSLPRETFEDYQRLGLARILQPRKYGGMQGSTVLLSRVVEELALGCPSSAWVLAVYGEHAWLTACFAPQAQDDVWASEPTAVVSSSLAPRAVARPVEGGYRLTGTYPFASGCKHASWIIVGAWVPDGEQRQMRYMLVPMREVEILDDWHTLGLRGTGSNTVALHDVFIPEHRSVRDTVLHSGATPGQAAHPDYPLVGAPRVAFAVFTQLPVTLGLARKVLQHLCTSMRGRVSRGAINLSESQVVQLKIGEASADIDAALTIAHRRHLHADRLLRSGQRLSPTDLLACRRDSVWANQLARQGIDKLVSVTSAEIVHDRNDLQAWLRDALTTGVHFSANWENAMVPYGKMQLGLSA
jgi:3-hydroxy-9,10-secoandrosta-1,3,5(10)-triene-9,17-dione monooxygenase